MRSISPSKSVDLEIVDAIISDLDDMLDAIYSTTDHAYANGALSRAATYIYDAQWLVKQLRAREWPSTKTTESDEDGKGYLEDEELPIWDEA